MKPKISNDPMYQLLREEKITKFNARFGGGEKRDLSNCDFQNVDLRGLQITKMDLGGSYFRQADLRGIDLSELNLAGASIHGAKISGALLPKALCAQEILLSLHQPKGS